MLLVVGRVVVEDGEEAVEWGDGLGRAMSLRPPAAPAPLALRTGVVALLVVVAAVGEEEEEDDDDWMGCVDANGRAAASAPRGCVMLLVVGRVVVEDGEVRFWRNSNPRIC